MAEFVLKHESVEMLPDFNVLNSEFENKSRQTRLVTPEMLITWKITTPNLTKAGAQSYLNDFMANFGNLSRFTFTCPVSGTTYTVSYKAGSFSTTFAGGYFKCKFEFERVF